MVSQSQSVSMELVSSISIVGAVLLKWIIHPVIFITLIGQRLKRTLGVSRACQTDSKDLANYLGGETTSGR